MQEPQGPRLANIYFKKNKVAGEVAQVVEHMSSMRP
jgi:hypothetical protein